MLATLLSLCFIETCYSSFHINSVTTFIDISHHVRVNSIIKIDPLPSGHHSFRLCLDAGLIDSLVLFTLKISENTIEPSKSEIDASR